MNILEWQRWEVEGGFGVEVIEAPSKSVAIEFFMVSNGLLIPENPIRCEPTDKPLYGSKEDVIRVLGGVDAMKVRELDAHHNALLRLQRRYAVAKDVVDASYAGFHHGPFETIRQALDVKPEHSYAVLCEIYTEGPTIIKHYWNGTRWVVAGSLKLLVDDDSDENSPIRYGFPGTFELEGIPVLPFMRAHDQIVDNGGEGRTVYVHRCSQCGRLFTRNTMALVPMFCGQCKEGERFPGKPKRKIVL